MIEQFGGGTVSAVDEPGFLGFYRGPTGWIEDLIAIIFSDTLDARDRLETKLRQLMLRLDRFTDLLVVPRTNSG
jgi:hypothetical protein